MIKLFCLIFLLCLTACYNQETLVDKRKLSVKDIRLYQSTPAWSLAKAVMDEDLEKIKEEITINRIPVDYQELRFGNTLLMVAILNGKYQSSKALLQLGANPNLHNNSSGTNAVILAAWVEDSNYLKLVLEYKGDPNSIENIFPKPNSTDTPFRFSALTSAVNSYGDKGLEKVKLLLEAGADINYSEKGIIQTVLGESLIQGKMDIAMGVIEKGADYKVLITSNSGEAKELSVLHLLRSNYIELDSEQYIKKMEIVSFLKTKGLDYDKEPIPEGTEEIVKNLYPDNWREYLKKY